MASRKKSRPLVRIASRIFGTPILIQEGKLDVIIEAFQRYRSFQDYDDEDEAIDMEESPPLPVNGRVAVLQVHGPLVHRVSGLEAMCGMYGYTDISQALFQALSSPDYDAILLDVDSPGGECAGCFELVNQIYEGRSVKPIIGIANEMAFSAGYAILSACSKVYITETSHLGSIGVVATHIDQSEADKKAGLKYTHIFAGKHKIDFNSHEPLSQNAKSTLQSEVDAMYRIFVESVARNRGLSSSAVAGTEAGLFMGKDAITAGLADEVIAISELSEKIQETLMANRSQKIVGAPAASATPNSDPTNPTPAPAPEPAPDSDPDDAEEEEDEDEDTTKYPSKSQEVTPVDLAADRKRMAKISNLCTVAGKPELAAGFIEKGLSVDQAKAALFDRMASGEVPTQNAHDATRSAAEEEGGNLLVAAMQDLNKQGYRGRREVN